MNSLQILTAFSALLMTSSVQGQVKPFGPFNPLSPYNASDCGTISFIADELNMCWYHQCVMGEKGYGLLPRECPLGTRLDYTYTARNSNPCTFNFGTIIGFECSRQQAAVAIQEEDVDCGDLTCANGGVLVREVITTKCWCNCTAEWMGHHDCSIPTDTNPITQPTVDGCGDGVQPDYCAEVEGCLNGGNCTNQCAGFTCDCPSPYRFGKRCERFTCERDGECFNGGTCRRGITGLNEFRRCLCAEGYFGFQCENSVSNLPVAGEEDGNGRGIGK